MTKPGGAVGVAGLLARLSHAAAPRPLTSVDGEDAGIMEVVVVVEIVPLTVRTEKPNVFCRL